ncbi:DNA-formamidopyrimidine glycosylase family protein [Glutamicibacter protophormiae]|uniref:DNA-formamidopyrimidine glycosylase family protein n=1 Tax=Glutamicibacter protophormiae TaxID=37930 RepID=UPI00195E8006|nr:DNA-formamidopyrimidine glycosylase family protein [Glutamicibacter protophormiae]QRQ79038.1 Fpg/Nei family DNA glycosylase [Glutamicibacter protophormiae]
MPEGDTVYRATARLHRALAGKSILRSDFRVPSLSTVDLAGYAVAEVVPRGKHLLMHLQPPAAADPEFNQPPLTLHSHLLMEGRWDLYGQGERFRRPAHTARIVLSFDGVTAVGFDIAQVKLVPTAEETQLVGHLGPDLLGTDWDAPLAIENFRAHPHRGIGEALLDQRLMAGVGNVYRCEVLFLTRLHPLTPIGQVVNLGKVIEMSQRLLEVNKDRPRRVTTGVARTREPYWVYGRAGRPCLRCGEKILLLKIAAEDSGLERDCYFCPSCQPARHT